MSLSRMIASGVVVVCLSVVGMGAPADASVAPSCVGLEQWNGWSISGARSYARVSNWCTNSVRVRMIWAWAFDGSCHDVSGAPWIGSNHEYSESRGGVAPYVSRLERC